MPSPRGRPRVRFPQRAQQRGLTPLIHVAGRIYAALEEGGWDADRAASLCVDGTDRRAAVAANRPGIGALWSLYSVSPIGRGGIRIPISGITSRLEGHLSALNSAEAEKKGD